MSNLLVLEKFIFLKEPRENGHQDVNEKQNTMRILRRILMTNGFRSFILANLGQRSGRWLSEQGTKQKVEKLQARYSAESAKSSAGVL